MAYLPTPSADTGFGAALNIGRAPGFVPLGSSGSRFSFMRSSLQRAHGQASRRYWKEYELWCPSFHSMSMPVPSVRWTLTFLGSALGTERMNSVSHSGYCNVWDAMYNADQREVSMKSRILITTALIISMCCLGAATSADKSSALVQNEFAAWNAHDPDRVASFFTDDVLYEDVAFGIKSHGHDELRNMAAGFFASVPDFKLEVVSNNTMGNRGSVEWIFSGTDVGLY